MLNSEKNMFEAGAVKFLADSVNINPIKNVFDVVKQQL